MTIPRDRQPPKASRSERAGRSRRGRSAPAAGWGDADAVLDALDANIAVVDASGTIRRVNEAWRRFGRENGARDDFLNQNYLAACAASRENAAEEALRLTRAVIAGEIQSFSLDYPCHGPSERRWFRLSARHLVDPGGAVLMHFDVTDRAERELSSAHTRHELELRVEERTAALERSNRELDAFAYAVAHDLKAPLRAVSGYARILLQRLSDRLQADDARRLERMADAAVRMSRLIDGLLRLAGLGRAPIARRECDLSQIAHELCRGLQAAEPQRSAQISIQPGMRGDGDPEFLRVLLGVLLDNAWRFSVAHEPIRIACGQTREHGREVFTVRDHGVGFDMAYYDKLFQPFQHLHDAGADVVPGDGFGLAFAKRIVELHGGELWAESTPGGGAAFHFTLGT